MELFLATGRLEADEYQGDTKVDTVIRLVEAKTIEEAEVKFIEEYEKESCLYGTSYTMYVLSITSVIR